MNSAESSLFDYLHSFSREDLVDSDFFLTLLSLVYPEFLEIEEYVFLKENFSEQRFNSLKEYNKQGLDKSINLVPVSEIFSYLNFDAQKYLAKTLVDIWSGKLKSEFSKYEFDIYYYEDEPKDIWCGFHRKLVGVEVAP